MLLAPSLSAQRVFVLAGQSNMEGRGDVNDLVSPYDSSQPDVKIWSTFSDDWATLSPGNNDHGPELSIGRALADHYGETIYLVKWAEGGSSMASDPSRPEKSWDPATGNLYGELKSRVTAALTNLGAGTTVDAFFWMQGEADSKDEANANAYLTNFENLIALAKNDFNSPDMAVVLGRVNGRLYPNATFGDKYEFVDTVQAAHEGAAETISQTAWVDTDALALNEDDLHFSSAGQIDLGNAMAQAFIDLETPPYSYTVERLNNGQPIIDEAMFEAAGIGGDGGNINGPSLIKVPDWIAPENRADPAANYYLYFAHHGGKYIRMAWAEEITGPYHFYRMESSIPEGDRGVYGLPGPDYEIEVQTSNPDQRIDIYGHLASPRVYVDDVNQRLVLFFHAPSGVYEFPGSTNSSFKGQLTLLTTSTDGLDFRGNLEPIRLGRSYFHVWEHDGRAYAFANDGMFFLSPEGSTISNDGWWTAPVNYDHHHNHVNNPLEDSIWRRIEPGPLRAAYDADPNEHINDPRHSATRKVGDELHIFYTCRNDGPEVIWMNKMDLSGDWSTWEVSWPPVEILRPELDWEGANYPPDPSTTGGATGVNQLRDPFVYEENGRIYLFYTGAGEEAIGLAELIPDHGGSWITF